MLEWDATEGDHEIEVRATDGDGETQTEERTRVDPNGASGLAGPPRPGGLTPQGRGRTSWACTRPRWPGAAVAVTRVPTVVVRVPSARWVHWSVEQVAVVGADRAQAGGVVPALDHPGHRARAH